MNVTEYAATSAIFVLTALVLWVKTRRSKNRFVRRQWHRPQWILLRLLTLFVLFGCWSFLSGVQITRGLLLLPAVALFAVFASAFDFTGLIVGAFAVVGRLIYEWIFWLPSRREIILRTRTSRSDSSPNGETGMIGVEGVAVTDLKPVGTIRIAGVDYSAIAELGFIHRGEKVLIKSAGDFEVRVRKVPEGGRA